MNTAKLHDLIAMTKDCKNVRISFGSIAYEMSIENAMKLDNIIVNCRALYRLDKDTFGIFCTEIKGE